MNHMTTLSELSASTGIEVLDHLDAEISVPVSDGVQAQGDLIVIPHRMLLGTVEPLAWTRTELVPRIGLELLRNGAGGNPHSLVAEGGQSEWSSPVQDLDGLSLGIVDTPVVAYLIHPEHGATGIAPGRYVIRRQRELGWTGDTRARFVVD
ncbi:hypothetical protein [Williamsia sterculiae]|uniref:Uncharacterized protein n=1 Tax=Williamsia sterculiae TaxID=1344003 RepID=A0A1N7H9Y4_9NOCA|nr:hypothetical protein [Williamsia sterculiae]SIS21689.1 hypothetical protein SAMN05445060_3812 [Williamsia sterculiae]